MAAIETSDSHSHANHGSPYLVKEKISVVGTRPFARIHSPARICHPVSESASSQPTPLVHQKSTKIGIRKARSDKEGIGQRCAGRHTAADPVDSGWSSTHIFPTSPRCLARTSQTGSRSTNRPMLPVCGVVSLALDTWKTS